MSEKTKDLIGIGLAILALVLIVVVKINLDAGNFKFSSSSTAVMPTDPVKESAENYKKGIKAFEAKDYPKAEEYLLKVSPSDPNYSETKSKLAQLSELMSAKYLSDAKSAIAANDPTMAKTFLTIVLQYKADSQEAKILLSQVESKLNEEAAKRQAEEEAKRNPPPIQLSGSGQQASDKFTLTQGLSVFKMSHSGSGNFAVWLLDSNGKRLELLANNIGTFDGSKAFGIKQGGTYILDVEASWKWSVTIEQPRPTTAPETTQFSGNSQQATQLFHLGAGLKKFKMYHQGKGNFSIWLLDANGLHEELLVNQLGNFNGSKGLGIRDEGLYLLDVEADGSWTVNIE